MAHFNCLLTIAVLSFVSTSDATCKSPFQEVGSACIYVNSEEKMNWSQARDYCRAIDYSYDQPDLAVVNDCRDLNPIRQHLLLYHGVGDYWLGGYDIAQEGFWHWVNDQPIDMGIPFWVINSPDGGSQENCLRMMYPSGYFDDTGCMEENYVLCSV
ncbi:C-type lectin domain family 17, member A-like isoform X4 [Panulirus ornatus]|uniref:C-type lectin domain family 17, member A-like isoform X2 n=1 Tax=Panulirus ornatus TaxID=150431 RepID=UPI003A8C2D4B